jgi:hypothetical protein
LFDGDRRLEIGEDGRVGEGRADELEEDEDEAPKGGEGREGAEPDGGWESHRGG